MDELENIIGKCKKGDRKAAEQIYKMFSTKMFAICLRFSKDRSEAEDNLQDGFIKIFESLGQYAGKGSFEGWMKRIFINVALEKFRKRGPLLQLVEEIPEVPDMEVGNEIRIPAAVLQSYLSQLPERYKMVFNLYVFEDLPHKEIAAMLGITEGTSKSNLARAREILKNKIKTYLSNER